MSTPGRMAAPLALTGLSDSPLKSLHEKQEIMNRPPALTLQELAA